MKDMTGKRFGRLTVIEPAFVDARGEWHWACKCDCGNLKTVAGNKLRSGNTRSCGCLQTEERGKGKITHHKTDTKLYIIWLNMKARCGNPKNTMYYRYGGRGITVCQEWIHDFAEFMKWAESAGYQEGLSIERIDVEKGYSPENCRWIQKKDQWLNRSDSHRLTAFGKTQTMKEWSEETGIKLDTIERRVNAYGWSPEKAVSVKPKRRK